MYSKIIKNDIKKSKLISVTITAFILIAALLTSLAVSLIVNLLGGIDNMMVKAKSPHFMQMHSGEVDMERLADFADSQSNVEDHQVLKFLNIAGADITIGDYSLADSIQDNGLTVQGEKFDYLLDMDGEVIEADVDGEIYVPVFYMKEAQAELGDEVVIRGVSFKIAGFLRDSQMSSAMISSKRFLVTENDYQKIEEFGVLESLIEFRLKDQSLLPDFEAAYRKAGLEENGPPNMTYQLIKVANGITDGMMIAVLILISILVIMVTFLCVRFTLLAKVEDDFKEIGVLKAIGLRVSSIKRLYMAKYGAIAAVACIMGFLLSLVFQNPLLENIRLNMGEAGNPVLGLLFGMVGAAIIFAVIILYVNSVLRRFRKISAAQAVRFGAPQEKTKAARSLHLSKNKLFSANVFLGIKDVLSRKKLYVTMLLVLLISSFILIVPQNIYNTISSRNFCTYMGIGVCDMFVGVQQTDNILGKTEEIEAALEKDESVTKYAVFTDMMFDMVREDGELGRFQVTLGDHSAFPIEYATGGEPQTKSEIAISVQNAENLELSIGDQITLLVDGEEQKLEICGTYSDVTSGGKTAKALLDTNQKEVLGTSMLVEFDRNVTVETKASEYQGKYSYAEIASIDHYIEQSMGSMIKALEMVSYGGIAVCTILIILVTLLFMKMLVTKDRYSVSVLKVLGFTSRSIRKQYIMRSAVVLILGVVIGTILSNTLGELVGVAMISSFGAATFHFNINPLFAYVFSPILIAVCVYISTLIGVSNIHSIEVSKHIKE